MKPRTPVEKLLYFSRWQVLPVAVSLPHHLAFVLRGLKDTRNGVKIRLRLAWLSVRTHLYLECAHNPVEVLSIMEEIIELDPDVPGVIIECGIFNGGSTAKLSHAAVVSGRKILACDSFEGLPNVEQGNHTDLKPDFKKGEYQGRLPEVKENVRRFGRSEHVEFVPGWFDKSLQQLDKIPISCAFFDVDLQESFRDCLRVLWKNVNSGGKVFIHDIDRPAVVDVFTDTDWWGTHLGEEPPQLVGAYTGIGRLQPLLGFAIKPII